MKERKNKLEAGKVNHTLLYFCSQGLQNYQLPILRGAVTIANGAGEQMLFWVAPRSPAGPWLAHPLKHWALSQLDLVVWARPRRPVGMLGWVPSPPQTSPSPRPVSVELLPRLWAERRERQALHLAFYQMRGETEATMAVNPITPVGNPPSLPTGPPLRSGLAPKTVSQNVVPQTSLQQNQQGGYRFPGPWVRLFL